MELKPGYKQTEVGVIPEDWKVAPLTGKVSITHGFAFSSEHFSDQGPYKLTTPGHFHETGGFRDVGEKQKFYIGPVPSEYVFAPFDLVVAMTEQADGLLGSAALIPSNDYLHNQRLGRVYTTGHIAKEYLYYLFNSLKYRAGVRETAAGTKVKHTSPQKLLAIPVPLPPLPEQRAIATALSEVDGLIRAQEQLIAKKRDLKQAAMQQLLTAQHRLPGFSGEWPVKRLGEIIKEISDGGTPSTANNQNFGGTVAWVVIDDIRDDIFCTKTTLTERGLQSCAARLWPAGTLILSTGATIGEVGIARVPLATKQGICGLILHPAHADTVFLKYWFIQNKPVLLSKAQGSSIKEVRAPTLVQFEIKLPPLPEQTAIAEVLSEQDEELAALEARLAKTRALKQGMMQSLLTGRIRLV